MIGLVSNGAAGWWFIPKGNIRYKAGLTVAVLSLLTGWWALTPTLAHESAQIPTVGPSLLTSQQANTDISGSTNQKSFRLC